MKKGISLITLTITIVVVIILSVAIVLTFSNNNPIDNAKEAKLREDFDCFKAELQVYVSNKKSKTLGSFDENTLNATKNSLEYDNKPEDEVGNLFDVIPSAKESYADKIEIKNGKILFSSINENDLKIAAEYGFLSVYNVENGVLRSTNSSSLMVDSSGTLYIPSNVTTIAQGTFHNLDDLKTVVIPGSVKNIDNYAFSNNKNLTSVVIQEGVEKIGEFAFARCTNLKTVSMPDSIVSIGHSCFSECKNLNNVNLSNSLKTIPYRLFSGCSNFSNLTIPDSVETLSSNFIEGTNITTLNIPKNVKTLTGALANNKKIKNVTIDENNQYFSIKNGIIMDKSGSKLITVIPTVTNLDIPESVTEILSSAFNDLNSKITSIYIGKNVTKISSSFPSTVTNIEVENLNKNYSSEDGVLYNADKTRIIRYAPKDSSIIIKDGVKILSSRAINYNNNLINLQLPDSLETIESFAIYGCQKLNSLEISKNVKDFNATGFNSFYGKITVSSENIYFKDYNGMILSKDGKNLVLVPSSNLSVQIPQTVETINRNAFYTSKISEISIPSNVKTIKGGAFELCSNLTKVNISSSIEVIEASAFSRCYSLQDLRINKKANSIKNSPFGVPAGEKAIIWEN